MQTDIAHFRGDQVVVVEHPLGRRRDELSTADVVGEYPIRVSQATRVVVKPGKDIASSMARGSRVKCAASDAARSSRRSVLSSSSRNGRSAAPRRGPNRRRMDTTARPRSWALQLEADRCRLSLSRRPWPRRPLGRNLAALLARLTEPDGDGLFAACHPAARAAFQGCPSSGDASPISLASVHVSRLGHVSSTLYRFRERLEAPPREAARELTLGRHLGLAPLSPVSSSSA